MKIPLIILVVFLFCCSCGPGKRLPVQTENRDSIRVEVREKTVYIRDTVYMTIPAQSAENTTRDTSSHLETDYAESDARINPDGTLHHSLRNKPQEKPVPVDVPQTQKDSIVYRGPLHLRDHRSSPGTDLLAEMADAQLLDTAVWPRGIRPQETTAYTYTKIHLNVINSPWIKQNQGLKKGLFKDI